MVNVGKFAEGRARSLLESMTNPPRLTTIPHPSPASPAANHDWPGQVLAALHAQNVPVPEV
jgi:single-strand selective monofunctional uracil DNA glycosylase